MSEKRKILHDGETSYGTACTGEEVVVDPQSTETVKSLLRKAGGTWGHGESHHLLEEKEPARKRKLLEKTKIEPSIGERKSGRFSPTISLCRRLREWRHSPHKQSFGHGVKVGTENWKQARSCAKRVGSG